MKNKLNIAVIGSPSLPIPPFGGYGGTQRGIYDFVKGMNSKGHKISLFGSGDSDVSHLENISFYSIIKKSLWIPENNGLTIEEKKKKTEEHYRFCIDKIIELDKQSNFDLINLRSDDLQVLEDLVNEFGRKKIIYSLHNVRNQSRIEKISDLGVQCVAHCRNHKIEHSNLPNVEVVTYGIDVHSFPFSDKTLSHPDANPSLNFLKKIKNEKKDYLITLGAIAKHKGQRTCIELAKRVGYPLVIAGAPFDKFSDSSTKYFEEFIKPKIDNKNVYYFGNANEEEKKELLRYSKAFIFPSGYEDNTWAEPFGRAPVEALSCGTPVIAYRKGSMEEIIYDRFNGFLFDNFDEGVRKLNELDEIKRDYCRNSAEKKFDYSRVVDDYEKLFFRKLKNGYRD